MMRRETKHNSRRERNVREVNTVVDNATTLNASERSNTSVRFRVYQDVRAQWLITSWKTRFLLFGIVVFASSIVSAAINVPVLVGVLWGAGAALGVAALLSLPHMVAVVAVVAGYFMFLIPLSQYYAIIGAEGLAKTPQSVDVVGATAALGSSFLFAVWVGIKFGRGREWVTTLLLAVSTVVPGAVLAAAFPALEVNGARIAMLGVLMWRCGGLWWTFGAITVVADKLRGKPSTVIVRDATTEDLKAIRRWPNRSQLEQKVDTTLELVPHTLLLFRVNNPQMVAPIESVLVSEKGIFVTHSVTAQGPIKESTQKGIQIAGVPLEKTMATLWQQRKLLTKKLRISPKSLEIVLVVSGTTKGFQKRLAVHEGTKSIPEGTILMVSPDMLQSAVEKGGKKWTRFTSRIVARKIVHKFTFAPSPIPVAHHNDNVLRSGDPVVLFTQGAQLESLRVSTSATDKEEADEFTDVVLNEFWNANERIPPIREHKVPTVSLKTVAN